MDKTKFFLISLLLTTLIIVSFFSFILGKETTITGMAIANAETKGSCTAPEFKAYTQAFCKDKKFYKECKDILMVECGDAVHRIDIINGTANVELNWSGK